jgi:hypothetical protein
MGKEGAFPSAQRGNTRRVGNPREQGPYLSLKKSQELRVRLARGEETAEAHRPSRVVSSESVRAEGKCESVSRSSSRRKALKGESQERGKLEETSKGQET